MAPRRSTRILHRATLTALLLLAAALPAVAAKPNVVVLVSANTEWKEVRKAFPYAKTERSPYGEFFTRRVAMEQVVFFHGGWGKIDAAASAQYVIDRFRPRVLINLGTCGGIAGRIERFATVLVTKTVVYDIIEQMGDSAEAIAEYTTTLDLDWLGKTTPGTPVRGTMLSADRDGVASEVNALADKYGAAVVDWESGSIARVARRNGVRVVILRGVTDIVGPAGDAAYGSPEVFALGTERVMKQLLDALPPWIEALRRAKP